MLRWPHSSLVTCHLSLILHLASTNAGKLREFRQAGIRSGISVEPVPGAQNLPPCVEDGATVEENARKKAVYYSAYVEGLVFADEPGVSGDAAAIGTGVEATRRP